MMTDAATEASALLCEGPSGFHTRPPAVLVDLGGREAALAAAEHLLAHLDGQFWEPVADRNTIDVDQVAPLVGDLENVLWLAVDVLAGRDPCDREESAQALIDHHAAISAGKEAA